MYRALGLLAVLPAVALASPVWKGDFETGDLSQWSKTQEVSADRLEVVTSPVHQGKYALKATVKQGDNPIGASGNRNELIGESASPEGSEFYYRWSTMFAPDYPSENTWQVFTQWHQSGCCGVPPIEFDVNGEKISLILSDHEVWSAPLVRGQWHDFVFHVKWSNDSSVGFVELWYDGEHVLPKLNAQTTTDTYLKQGLYRNSTISADGVVYHDGMIEGTSLDDVMSTDSPDTQQAPQVASAPPASSGSQPAAPSDGSSAGTPSSSGSQPSSSSGGSSAGPTASTSGNAIASANSGGGCSASGSAGLSLLALGLVAWTLARRARPRP